MTTSPKLFTESLPLLPRAFDSTMLGLAKECLRKFKYIIIDGWNPRGFAAHLAFGIAYHKALETADRDKAKGASHDQALLNAIQFCLTYGERDADGTFVPYTSLFTKEPTKTRDTLVRSVVWYLDHFTKDPAKTVLLASGEPAVELSFQLDLELHTPDGDPFILCGHLDRVVELEGSLYFTDRKTTKYQISNHFWNQFVGPNNQISLYYAATQAVLREPARGGIIDAVELGATYSRFARRIITKTPGQLSEWLTDTYYWINQVQQAAAEDHWPMNDKSCSNYGGCPFLSICSRDPKVRQQFLEHEGFIKRQWNPLESR